MTPVVALSPTSVPRRQCTVGDLCPSLPRKKITATLQPSSARPVRSRQVRPNAAMLKRRAPLIRIPPLLSDEPFILRDLQPPREFARGKLRTLVGNRARNLEAEVGITEQHSVRNSTILCTNR